MERPPDAIQKYLSAMKERTGMSWADLSAATRLPDSTIRKIFSGETADPRLETISLIVSAMGGSLDTMLEGAPEPETPPAALSDFSALQESCEKRLEEVRRSAERYVNSLKRDKYVLFIICCILAGLLVMFLILDLTLGSVGWIRYWPKGCRKAAFCTPCS